MSEDGNPATHLPVPPGGRLLDRVREPLRYLHDSLRTEQACVYRVRGFVRFQGMHHPREMGAAEVQQFLALPA